MRKVRVLAIASGLSLIAVSALAAESAPKFEDIQQIISARCQSCHSENPDQPGIYDAPMGVKLDTPAEIHAYAPRILQKAVKEKIMPLGNITQMTDQEREALGTWIAAGAKIQ